MPQSDTTARNAVWPTDIFGIKAYQQEIAHLIPAGDKHHKQWLNVACAALGIQSSVNINVKKKAARGCVQALQDAASSTRATSDSSRIKGSSRKEGTGVIHFVTNKIRLLGQRSSLDGKLPSCLIVPVMSLEDAKMWRGKGYVAVCLAGIPKGVSFHVVNNGNLYAGIGLTNPDLLKVYHTRDATSHEVGMACDLLVDAVLALQDMIASFSEEELEVLDDMSTKTLRQARDEAKENKNCKVPRLLTSSESSRKPACLVRFGDPDDTTMHPAPDPLLLALRAANIFGLMTGMKMLASGETDDSDVSIGDIIEEEAFLEAREESLRPKTRDDLARGLGQPNGYFASIVEPDCFSVLT